MILTSKNPEWTQPGIEYGFAMMGGEQSNRSVPAAPNNAWKHEAKYRLSECVSEDIWTALNIEVLRADEAWSVAGMKGPGKRKIPEKTRRPTASSGAIPRMRKSGVTRPGIESGSPWWEASRLTAEPPWPHMPPNNVRSRNQRIVPQFSSHQAKMIETHTADEALLRCRLPRLLSSLTSTKLGSSPGRTSTVMDSTHSDLERSRCGTGAPLPAACPLWRRSSSSSTRERTRSPRSRDINFMAGSPPPPLHHRMTRPAGTPTFPDRPRDRGGGRIPRPPLTSRRV
ncbi:hypothetical protein PR048_022458 [Dryococelus australis]|uniref:Uncharacterized protein n=1 Tax=Dryococelus australis TaxID=614101 RepID=A0ABQ9H118_9NEOP|nr:hypothetical protein PR048_022458 [Dryococelus australis]